MLNDSLSRISAPTWVLGLPWERIHSGAESAVISRTGEEHKISSRLHVKPRPKHHIQLHSMSAFPICPHTGGASAPAGGLIPGSSLTPVVIASVGIGGSALAFGSMAYFTRAVLKENEGNLEMRRLRGLIYDGAKAYLLTQCELAAFLTGCVRRGSITALTDEAQLQHAC